MKNIYMGWIVVVVGATVACGSGMEGGDPDQGEDTKPVVMECETPGAVECTPDGKPGEFGNIRRCREDHTWQLGGCLIPPVCRMGACVDAPPATDSRQRACTLDENAPIEDGQAVHFTPSEEACHELCAFCGGYTCEWSTSVHRPGGIGVCLVARQTE